MEWAKPSKLDFSHPWWKRFKWKFSKKLITPADLIYPKSKEQLKKKEKDRKITRGRVLSEKDVL